MYVIMDLVQPKDGKESQNIATESTYQLIVRCPFHFDLKNAATFEFQFNIAQRRELAGGDRSNRIDKS